MAEQNWDDSTIFIGDNLKVMREMNSGHIDLIYLDPPFNSNHNYAAPIGSKAAGAEFKDTWTLQDVDEVWHGYLADKHPALYQLINAAGEVSGDSMKSYLIYMAMRILEMRRLLKSTGSIYLHCDPTAGHYLKLTMDAIFGRQNFRNEIIWHYLGSSISAAHKVLPRKHDVILFYSVSSGYVFNSPREQKLSEQMRKRWGKYLQSDGKTVLYGSIKHEKGEELRSRKRIERQFKRPPRDTDIAFVAKPSLVRSVWTDIPEVRNNPKYRESTGYPTQKPLALLMRIIKTSSNPGDIVFDPFAGCTTTCIAASKLERKWVGIDISPKAGELIRLRMEKELGLDFAIHGNVTDKLPKRSSKDRTEGELFSDVRQLPYNHPTIKQLLFGKQEERCNGCQEVFRFKTFEIDHITPRSKGGKDHINNLQLLCPNCNRRKGNKDMKAFVKMMLKEKEESMEKQKAELERMKRYQQEDRLL